MSIKKIGNIKGIPVVEGDPNKVNTNVLHYKQEGKNISISKRDTNGHLKSITGSSNGNVADAVYYYKVVNDSEVLVMLLSYIQTHSVISGNGILASHIVLSATSSDMFVTPFYAYSNLDLGVKAFAVNHSSSTCIFMGITGNVNMTFHMPEGDLKEKAKSLILGMNGGSDAPPEEIEAFLNQLDNTIDSSVTQISKEEYYSLATNI